MYGVFFGLFALFFVNAQYLQYVKAHSLLTTGVAILTLPIAMFFASRRSATLATHTLVAIGMTMLSLGLTAMSSISESTPFVAYGLVLVVIATGMGLSAPAQSTGIVSSIPPHASRRGLGTQA